MIYQRIVLKFSHSWTPPFLSAKLIRYGFLATTKSTIVIGNCTISITIVSHSNNDILLPVLCVCKGVYKSGIHGSGLVLCTLSCM